MITPLYHQYHAPSHLSNFWTFDVFPSKNRKLLLDASGNEIATPDLVWLGKLFLSKGVDVAVFEPWNPTLRNLKRQTRHSVAGLPL